MTFKHVQWIILFGVLCTSNFLKLRCTVFKLAVSVSETFLCMRKEFCVFRREAKIAELIMSSTVYEDLLTKVNRGRQFYDKLESKVKQLLERTHRVCKAEQEERTRIRDRLAPKGSSVLYSLNLTQY